LLTHIEDYALDFKAALAGIDAIRIDNQEFMELVNRPMLERKADASATIIGKDTPCVLGARVELLPSLEPQGIGTVTKVRHACSPWRHQLQPVACACACAALCRVVMLSLKGRRRRVTPGVAAPLAWRLLLAGQRGGHC